MQQMTVALPEVVFHRLVGMAQATHQSVDAVLVQSLRGNLPPVVDDLPLEMRDQMAQLTQMNDAELWSAATSPLPPRQWRRHEELLEKNAEGTLTPREAQELAQLRDDVDRWVVRRSYAAALLKWRGYSTTPPAP